MARWAFRWVLLITLITVVSYTGTNAIIANNDFASASYAMLPVGELGSPACTRATRGLVAAGDGAAPGAPAEQRQAYDLAAAGVRSACGGA
jgi:hypothetical protein